MHFQQSTASIHVFTYESEFILCPLQPDLFWMVNEKISGAIVAIFLRLASPAHLPMKFLRATWRGGGGGCTVEPGGLCVLLVHHNEKNSL